MALYSINDAQNVLGCLLNNPLLCLDDKYKLDKYDFQPNMLHYIIFISISNLVSQGAKEVSGFEIDQYLSSFNAQSEIFNDNNGLEFCKVITELNSSENIDVYYNNVKKFSVLRRYKENGFDISRFYDETKSESGELEKLASVSVEDILGYYEGLQCEIRKQFCVNGDIEEYIAGADFAETKERLKEEPLCGDSFQSTYLNAICRGMYGFILRVAKSGGGKTTLSIGDLCNVTCTQYWDDKEQKFVINKSRTGASLFINTEMDLRNELDLIIISWISNVPRGHIMDGKYEGNEEWRVDKANEILKESELYVVDDPKFTTKSLTTIIKDYSINKNIKNCCFDYVQNNGYVSKELSSETKVPQREDMVLLTLTDRLKQVQRETGIGLISSVQTNGNEDNMPYPTEAVLAGGKSQVRKTDCTMCMLPPTKKELEHTKLLGERKGFGNHIEPNNVVHIIKGRANKYPRHIKIFQYIDLGTSRSVDLFCTNKNDEPINIEKLIIENKG